MASADPSQMVHYLVHNFSWSCDETLSVWQYGAYIHYWEGERGRERDVKEEREISKQYFFIV